uniref:Uncharacterized protein n=1 Tax=Anguilla anguilla TaxID=7936 RepID=A0A0E9T2F5_ANGAN
MCLQFLVCCCRLSCPLRGGMRFPLNAETLSIFRSRLNTLILTEQWLP